MKRKLLRKVLCLIICSSMMIGLFSEPILEVFAVSEETQEEIDKAEEEKEQLEQELQQQEQDKGELEDNKATAEEKLENLKEQYQSISSDLEALEVKKAEKEAEITAKTEELEKAIATQEKQYEDMKMRIRYMYEKPQDTLFALFLEKGSIIQILNRVDHTVKIQEYDRSQLEEFTKNTEEIELQKQELEAAKVELEELIKEAELQQQKVSSLQKQTSATIKDYLNQIASAEEVIGDTEAELKAKSEALKKLYDKAAAEKAAEDRRKAEEEAKKLQESIANGTIKPEDSEITYGQLNLTQDEIDMLTAIIYCEARGESYEGQLAVGHVIMNRVRSAKFKQNTVEEVIRAPKQFSPVSSGIFDIVLTAYKENIPGIINESAWSNCQKAALVCVNSESNVGESLFFRTHAPVPQLVENLAAANIPYWIIGNHIFYYSWVNY